MSGGSPACMWSARAPGRSCVPSQSTIAPVSFSQADLTVSKLSNSGPLHRPRTWTCAPPRPCEAVLVAPAVTVVVAVAGAECHLSPSSRATRAATSIARPAIRVAVGRTITSDLGTLSAYRPDRICRTGPMKSPCGR